MSRHGDVNVLVQHEGYPSVPTWEAVGDQEEVSTWEVKY